MIELIILLLILSFSELIYIFKLQKTNAKLHLNNIGLGQALVDCGAMPKSVFENSIVKIKFK
ncbi:MAG: hypothetical protein HFI86_02065 [Bacilli bacterium]|nr:hypothetical protein [Bacilli bacterium]